MARELSALTDGRQCGHGPLSDGRADFSWRDLVFIVILTLVCTLLWWQGRVDGHPWGDDWAGYVLQARSVGSGTVRLELETNSAAMRGGDVQVGPDAYPWGYPLALAGVRAVAGEDIESYKVVGLASLFGFVVSVYLLARALLPPGLGLFVALSTTLQPGFFTESGYLGSDLPFAALATAALALTMWQWLCTVGQRRAVWWIPVLVAGLSVAAFSVRSNGVVSIVAYPAMLVVSRLRGDCPPAMLLRDGLLFGSLVLVGLLAYFLALPDGSLSHAGYLSFDPIGWAQRGVRHFHYMASWPTFDLLRGPLKLAPFTAFVALCGAGWWHRRWEGSLLAAYIGAHLALITVFPFDGGVRYYHPMLAPAFVMVGLGLYGVLQGFQGFACGSEGSWSARTPWIASGIIGVIGLGGVLAVRAEQRRIAVPQIDAPFGAAARELAEYVSAVAPTDARIGFFKPRAFRLMSGRLAYAIHDPANLVRVDWYVFNRANSDPRLQVPESALLAPDSGFRIVREMSPFRIYARFESAPRENIRASARGVP